MSEPMTWDKAIAAAAPKFNEIANREKLVTWAEESQFAMQAIQTNTRLAECSINSVQNAIINVAAVGLTLNPLLGYAYLVPEAEKAKIDGRDQWVQQCRLRVSYKGMLKIANDSGSILWAKAETVCTNDHFEYNGPAEKPTHRMNPFTDRGQMVGVYCVAKTHQGDYLTDVMNIKEINECKDAAKTKGVWEKWFGEMAKKAVIKRASKQWPKTDHHERLDRAVGLLHEEEGSDFRQEKDITPQRETITDKQAESLRHAIEMAGLTEEKFCGHKSIRIASLGELPAARYEGAMNYLKSIAAPQEETADAVVSE